MVRTPRECCGSTCSDRASSVTQRQPASRPAARSSFDSLACIESASSTPPAPAPTTTSRQTAPRAMASTRATMASHWRQKPSMGLTGVMQAPAAAPVAAPPTGCGLLARLGLLLALLGLFARAGPLAPCGRNGTGLGAEPMSIESTSYLMGGRPLRRTCHTEGGGVSQTGEGPTRARLDEQPACWLCRRRSPRRAQAWRARRC